MPHLFAQEKNVKTAEGNSEEINLTGGQMSNPRPFYKSNDLPKNVKRFSMGGSTAGIVMDLSKEGIQISGYYRSQYNDETLYANVREPVFIPWDEFEKARDIAMNPNRPKGLEPDKIDEPDEKYLESLPKVTLNGVKYYIDAERKERRPVKTPKQVYKF